MLKRRKKTEKPPSVKKNLKMFLTSEEGRIAKKKIGGMAGMSMGVGMGVAALLMYVKSAEAACAHTSHGSHSSHASHASHGSHGSHGSY